MAFWLLSILLYLAHTKPTLVINKQLLERFQLAALFIALLGGGFKLMHWPGANIMLIVGMGNLVIYYIISGFIPPAKNRKAVLINYARSFATAILIAGLLFYIMRWQGAKLMLIEGTAGVALSFVLQFIWPDNNEE